MTDLVPATPNDVLVTPHSGELLDLRDAPAVARALRELREHDQRVRDAKAILTDALVQAAQRAGTKTLRLEGVGKVELTGGPDSVVHWDLSILEQLLDAGLPEDRWNELVTLEVSYKVNATVAKSIAGANPKYREIVDMARQRADRPWAARVSAKGSVGAAVAAATPGSSGRSPAPPVAPTDDTGPVAA